MEMEREFDDDMPDKPAPPEDYEVPEAPEELPQPSEQPEDPDLR